MYIPAEFEEQNEQVILDFLKEMRFGTLVCNGEIGFPLAGHFPFLLKKQNGRITIEIHLSRANELALALQNGGKAKLIVSGAEGYISSSLYSHVNVPTYNYQAIHLSGTAEQMSGLELVEHLRETVADFEAGRENKAEFENWPKEMIRAYLAEIIGLRINVEKTEAAFKLSQNRNDADLARITEDLQTGSMKDRQLAAAMLKNRK